MRRRRRRRRRRVMTIGGPWCHCCCWHPLLQEQSLQHLTRRWCCFLLPMSFLPVGGDVFVYVYVSAYN
jgi:hypothetical protein